MNVVQKIFLHSSKVKIALHIGYWAFYMLCVSTILFKSSETSEIFTIGKYAIWLAVSMPFKWVIFYGYYYILIPKWFTDKTWKFFGITILLLLVYPFVKYGLDQLVGTWSIPTLVVNTEDKEPYVDYLIEFFRRFYTPLFLIIFAFFMRFVLDWFRNIRIKEKMEREQLKSELAMLKNQVSPHFLFNVLNNIDTLVYPHSKEASEAIVKISSIMRYMLYETNSDKVIIGKEIEYLEAYIELQKMRLKDPSKIKFDASSVDSSSLIAPMLLVPFVENAFKHAAAISGPEIELSVTTTNDSIHFHIINNINNTVEEQKDEVGGIGLKNVHRRLELLYPGKHDLSISNNGESFEVTLKLSTEE